MQRKHKKFMMIAAGLMVLGFSLYLFVTAFLYA